MKKGQFVKIYSCRGKDNLEREEIKTGSGWYYVGKIIGFEEGEPVVKLQHQERERYDYYLEAFDVVMKTEEIYPEVFRPHSHYIKERKILQIKKK